MYIGKLIKDKETGKLWRVNAVSVEGEADLGDHSRFYIKILLEQVSLGPTIWDTKIMRNTIVLHDKKAEEEFFKELFKVPFPKPSAFVDIQK